MFWLLANCLNSSVITERFKMNLSFLRFREIQKNNVFRSYHLVLIVVGNSLRDQIDDPKKKKNIVIISIIKSLAKICE